MLPYSGLSCDILRPFAKELRVKMPSWQGLRFWHWWLIRLKLQAEVIASVQAVLMPNRFFS